MEIKIDFKIRNNFDDDLKKEWEYLSNLCQISLFQSYTWQLAWFENINKHNPKNSICIISVYFDNKVVSIIPFEKKNFLNLNILSLTGFPFADYGDCLVDSVFFDLNPTIKIEIIKYLSNIKNVDMIKIENILENNNIHNLFNKNNFKKNFFSSYQLCKINNYKEIISKKFVNDTKRQIKRLKVLGELSFDIAKTNNQKDNIFNFFLKFKKRQLINTKNWNYLDNKVYINFLKKIYTNNQNHLSCITLNKEIIAVHMGNVFNKKMFYLFPAYNKSYSKYSPGNILIYKLIENLSLDEVNEFDFTTGDESYKLKLSNSKKDIFYKNIEVTLKGQIYSKIWLFLVKLKNNYYIKSIYNKIMLR